MSSHSKNDFADDTRSQRTGGNDGEVEVVDVASVTIENPHLAIRRVSTAKPHKTLECDVLIVGGGVGGVAAAAKIWRLTSDSTRFSDTLKLNKPISVILTEETDWLGGQMTAQGVPALDENYLVETSGATSTYQELRSGIRDYYREQTKLLPEAASEQYLNPGTCWVTRLAFEPKVALKEIEKMLGPAAKGGQLKILHRQKAFQVDSNNAAVQEGKAPLKIERVDLVDLDSGETCSVNAKFVLDATELGDVIALSGLDYASGSDSRSRTGEPHAPDSGDSQNVQDFTYPFVLELAREPQRSIAQPPQFTEFEKSGKFSFLGYKMFVDTPRPAPQEGSYLPFWEYRRLIDASLFDDERYRHDLAVINWESNDLRGQNLIDQPADVLTERLAHGKLVSLGFLYWLQNKVVRDDGGAGYPELLLREDVLGTKDGMSKYPYIRESRRIRAIKTIVEQDIVAAYHSGARAAAFEDSVGIGLYPVDIHGHQEIPGAAQETRPFQFGLTSLIPQEGGNLLPACKNIGVTHITNGAYRLHPIEWGIGEAQGALALFCLAKHMTPLEVASDPKSVSLLQQILVESGSPIFWFDDVATNAPFFSAVQYLAATNLIDFEPGHLSFIPNQSATREQAACALTKVLSSHLKPVDSDLFLKDVKFNRGSILKALSNGIFTLDEQGLFHPDLPFTLEEIERISRLPILQSKNAPSIFAFATSAERSRNSNVTRGELAQWIYAISKERGR